MNASLQQRNELREKSLGGELSAEEQATLETVSARFDAHSLDLRDQQSSDIAEIRSIIDRHRDTAELHLGGVPMIVADSIDFIRSDLGKFGVGVLAFLVLILGFAFRSPRWILLPLATCAAVGVTMVGFLGWSGWAITVVSSNFISVLLIITLSPGIMVTPWNSVSSPLTPQQGHSRISIESLLSDTYLGLHGYCFDNYRHAHRYRVGRILSISKRVSQSPRARCSCCYGRPRQTT